MLKLHYRAIRTKLGLLTQPYISSEKRNKTETGIGLTVTVTVTGTARVKKSLLGLSLSLLEMWANAQRDGRPAEYRWRPLFNAAKFG